jgi:hypothetical protein
MNVATSTTDFTKERVQIAIDAILEALGQPETDLHREALRAFQDGDSLRVKRLASTNLADNFCKCLGYLVSASKLTPNTDTILAESARAASEFVKDRTMQNLGIKIEHALN